MVMKVSTVQVLDGGDGCSLSLGVGRVSVIACITSFSLDSSVLVRITGQNRDRADDNVR